LLRDLRDGALHTHIDRGQPVLTIGAVDELSTLRAYEAGSDQHLAANTSYLVLRAAIEALARRTITDTALRQIRIGELHIDSAARSAHVNGTPVRLSRTEFDLLSTLASDPTRVFTKAELTQAIWGHGAVRGRALDSHIGRLRQRLTAAGAQVIHTRWGTGWSLTTMP
jgi:DNA-binding response OmpR family regulator